MDKKNIIVQQEKNGKKNVASHYTDEERTMANEHMTKYLLFLVIKKVNSSYTEKQFTTSNEQRYS